MKKLLRRSILLTLLVIISFLANAQAPVASFSATPRSSCFAMVVQFSDLSTNTPTSWSWDLGNGNTSFLQNPTTIYTTTGTYTVTLIVRNASGSDTVTYSNYIQISPPPTVNFRVNDSTTACGSKTVQLTNLSTPNSTGAATYFWDFGDGTSSVAQNPPPHTYSNPGTYSMSLVVTNGNGCIQSLSKPAYITVLSRPVSNFSAASTNSCGAPFTASFTDGSTGAASYSWDFGDGGSSTAQNPTHTYASSGSYTVRLITIGASGCRDTMTKTGFINVGTITAGFTASSSSACTGNPITFTNTSVPGGAGSTWYFGDGTTSILVSPTHAYATAGTYTVKLVVAYSNCSDSTTRTVTVSAGPTPTFTASPLTTCRDTMTVQFSNSTSGASSYLWIFGDGATSSASSPSHFYNNFGKYTISLVAVSSNGCQDTLTRPNYVDLDSPTATLSNNPSLGCAPATAAFTVNVNSTLPVTNYTWTFGDGGTGSGQNVTHTYSTVNAYTLKVVCTTSTGCLFVDSQIVNVGSHTTPTFTASPTTVCKGAPVVFTDAVTGVVTNLLWMFGDGKSSTQSNPTHIYDSAGTFTVSLISFSHGCPDTAVRSSYITVNPPVARFTATYPCTNRLQYTFTDASIGATSWSWDFGDSSPLSSLQNPVHSYAAYGTYTVKLLASSSITGCVDSFKMTLSPYLLTSAFTASDTVLCVGGSSQMFPADPNLPFYAWDYYGNGYYSFNAYPTPSFTDTGSYNIKLRVMDYQGCADSLTKFNYIKVHAPTAKFSATSVTGCAPLAVNLSDLSAASTGTSISTRFWDFGNGDTLTTTATSFTHVYKQAGTFTVQLSVTESDGCKDDTIRANLITTQKPAAAFSSVDTQTCLGYATQFLNTSTSSGALSYYWEFGDGNTSTLKSPGHIYAAAGNYTVKLVAIDAGICTDTLVKTQYIKVSTVKANFGQSDTVAPCPPFTVKFFDSSVNASTYQWSFGNGGTSSLANTSALYFTPGTFNVRLIVTNAAGCKDSAKHKMVIGTGPTGTMSYSPKAGCSPLAVTFLSTTSGADSLMYDLGNGVVVKTIPTSSTVNYTYAQPGRYKPTLILSDTQGCHTFIVGPDTIDVTKAYPGFRILTPNNSACLGVPVQFTDTSSAAGTTISTWTWKFGDGGTSTSQNPQHVYTTAGTYQVRLLLTTASGCLDSVTTTLVINPRPVVTAANQTICSTQSVSLLASGAATYAWKPSTGLSCVNCPNPTASPAATTTYTIIGTSAAGCVDSGTVTVTVNPLPSVSAGPDKSICAGASASITATGAATYSWSPATGLSSATGATVVASPASTTTYVVTGSTALGCSSTDTVVVTVNPLPLVTVTPSQSICAGASVSLTANGATTYSWSPATGLSATSGANVTASPSATTTYTVTGSNSGCSASATTTITVTPLPVVQITGGNTVCAGASLTLTASGALTYSWSPTAGLSSGIGSVVVASPAGNTTYTVSGYGATGCVGTASVSITVYPVPTVSAGPDTSLCAGDSVPLKATGALSYSWSPASGLSATNVATPSAQPVITTAYAVVGTDVHSCSDTDTVVVTVHPVPNVNAGSNISICPGGFANLSATGAVSYSWAPTTGLSCSTCATPVATPASTTTYVVTGTSSDGCIDTAHITVSINSKPTVTIGGSKNVCIGSGTTLTASGANSYSWSPAAGLSATTGSVVLAQPATTTSYTIIGTSGTGCSDTTTITIVVNSLPIVNAGRDTSICPGTVVTLNASGASTYSWSPSGSLSSPTAASPNAAPTTTTNYVVTGTDANGCVNRDSVLVTVNPLPTVSAGSNTTICPGGSTTLTATGASTYSWNPATGLSCSNCASPIATPAATTTYTVTGTSSAGCVKTANVTVTVNGSLAIAVAGTKSVCAGSSTTLTASGANSFTWSPAAGLNTSTGATVIAQPAATTTYKVIGTSGAGCTDSTTVTITVNPLPIVNAGVDTSVCKGKSVVLTATGANSYNWTPSATLSAGNIASPTATPASTTTYTVTGTDANGCVNKDSVLVTVNPLPNVTASSNTSICPGGSATLTAFGALTYSWTPSAGLSCSNCASPVATPSVTTVYVVTGTSGFGCIDTANVTVAVNSKPLVTLSGLLNICLGDTTTLNATGAGSYLWSPATGLSSATGSGIQANPATTTNYTLVGSSGLGCNDTVRFTITVNALPSVSAGVDTSVCLGSTVVLTATGASTYLWTPATGLSSTTVANPTASPATSTSYVVKGTDTKGCSSRDTVLVNVNQPPVVSAGSNTSICLGGSVTLNASGAATYSWTPSASLSCNTCANPTASPATTTTYVLTGLSAQGCVDTAHVTVTVSSVPQIVVAGNRSICQGSSTALTATGAANFAWTPATGLSCTSCANPISSPTTTTRYTITGTSGVGCTAQDTVTIVVNPLPVLTVIDTLRTCLNDPVTLSVSGALTYVWSPATGLSCTSCTSPQATPAANSVYTVIGTDVNGCKDTAQSAVIVKALPTVSAGADVFSCMMNSVQLHAAGAVTYTWSPSTGLSCTNCDSPLANPGKTTVYVVTGMASNDCVGRDTVSVILYDQPPVNAGPDRTICAGEVVNLKASGADTYVWNPGSYLTCTTCPDPVSTPPSTISYMVHGTDVHGCQDSDEVTIRVIERGKIRVDSGAEFCLGGSVQLHASGGTQYTWMPAKGLSCVDCANPVASPTTTTKYSVIIRQGSCFTDTLSSTVSVFQPPAVNAGPDQSIVLGSSVKLQTSGSDIYSYNWSPFDGLSCSDCEAPDASPLITTNYVVTVSNEHGCTASDEVRVTVRCDGSQIWLPNTFTPNADGQNDFFYPHGKGLSKINHFRIYDRWGELVFDRSDMPVNDRNSGWDGTYRNQTLKPDVYVWIINATCTNGDPLELKGDISLIR